MRRYRNSNGKFSNLVQFSAMEVDLSKTLTDEDLFRVCERFREATQNDKSRHISLLSTLTDLHLEEKYNAIV